MSFLFPPSSRRAVAALSLAFAASLAGTAATAASLADQPVFTTSSVPGNLALALSVEWPTASRTAHTDTYAASAAFLGYFDPDKCYSYVQNSARNDTDTGDTSYFNPTGVATSHRCTGANDAMWSGNFLNWAGTATIDPFRWAMTGGRRVVDTETETILEKGWHSGQGLFDDRDLPAAEIAGATPFNNASSLNISVNGRGFGMRVSTGRRLKGDYFNNISLTGSPSVTVDNDNGNHDWGTGKPVSGINATNFSARFTGSYLAPETGSYGFRVRADDGVRLWVNGTQLVDKWQDQGPTTYEGKIDLTKGQAFDLKVEYYQRGGGAVMQLEWKTPSGAWKSFADSSSDNFDLTMRTKVCKSDAPGGVEANCRKYGTNWKPEGLIQQYAGRMRFSAFGYLNDSSDQRDGGVMRSGQKFVGPMQPAPGLPDVDNTQKEWSSTTGIFVRNPNPNDAKATKDATGIQIDDSGVVNYLNKFGQLLPGSYKSYDPVSEMYYAVLRYYKNLGNIDAWSKMGTTDTATKKRYLDGFPVVTNWQDNDPIQYACQRNFILGIGDIYTHVDKNVPGNKNYRTREPAAPDFTTETVDAVKATNKIGALQGLGNLGNSNDYSGRNNSAYIAGLAYDANTVDIRPDAATQPNSIGKQTVQTYWVDVLEAPFVANNQFYLAAKFGGLKVPTGFDPYSDKTTAATIPQDWWSTNGDTLGGSKQPRPDNYFTAGRPDTMVDGLTRAFASIANAIKSFTTSFAPAAARVSADGTASYASQYDSNGWSGTVLANRIALAADGTPTSTVVWTTAGAFTTQLAGSGWDSARRVVTWNGTAGVALRSDKLNSTQLGNLDTPWAAGNDSADFVNYLRGDRSKEQTATDTTKPYRRRTGLLGDIVNAKVVPVGAPAEGFSEALNPGYAAYKKAKADRTPMVYAAANDGMLHAFNGALTGDNAGKEVFAYVPSALFAGPNPAPKLDGLAQLGNPNYEHRYYVDATPQAFDIDFNKAGTNYSGTSTKADWRTILVGGLGKGGRSFYAIDISDPDSAMASEDAAKGKVLWEFSDPTMGFSYGAPIALKTKKYGWVVVLSSGYNGSDSNGYIYLVNPINGQLLEKVSTGSSSAGLAQMTAFVRDFSDGAADAIYAGDLGGQLWRFDITSPRGTTGAYPAPTKIATLAGPSGAAQPITTQPLVEIDPRSRRRFVLVGTGQLLDTVDINASGMQSFYAIRDGTTAAFGETFPSGTSYPLKRSNLTALSNDDLVNKTSKTDFSKTFGWYLDLETNGTGSSAIGWRMVNNPTAYNGRVGFSTLLTTGNACSPSGQSRIYAIDFGTGRSVLVPNVAYSPSGNTITDLRFVTDSRGSTRLISGDVVGDLRNVDIEPPGGNSLRLLNWREIPGID